MSTENNHDETLEHATTDRDAWQRTIAPVTVEDLQLQESSIRQTIRKKLRSLNYANGDEYLINILERVTEDRLFKKDMTMISRAFGPAVMAALASMKAEESQVSLWRTINYLTILVKEENEED